MQATPEQERLIYREIAYRSVLVTIAREYERGLMTSQDLADRILLVTIDYMKGE